MVKVEQLMDINGNMLKSDIEISKNPIAALDEVDIVTGKQIGRAHV